MAAEEIDSVSITVEDPADAGLPAERVLSSEEKLHFKGLVEALLFTASEPLSIASLARRLQLDKTSLRELADELVDEYQARDGGVKLFEIAGGYQFLTSEKYAAQLRDLTAADRRETLSRSTLETLAIIAYRQPITLPEIDEIRGVGSRALVSTLLARKLIKPQGYRPVPGRPTLYVTSRQFLEHFRLNSLTDLPVLEDVKELKFDDF
ncbi:MAG: SMC-Scp complex subunit ScpB [Spirochaetales bacterium]|nr:SMC-Scp complex subunit ScpB [Spirochaetales bacterium]